MLLLLLSLLMIAGGIYIIYHFKPAGSVVHPWVIKGWGAEISVMSQALVIGGIVIFVEFAGR